jgi:NAD-dependent dihydropyrimidine dehydrogenase PreA subunit
LTKPQDISKSDAAKGGVQDMTLTMESKLQQMSNTPCTCCRQCSARFELKVHNTSTIDMEVTTKDLICHDPNVIPYDHWVARQQPSRPLLNGIPNANFALLFKLQPGGKVHFMLHAHRGTGRMHGKFIPCAPGSFKYIPQLKLSERVAQWLPAEKNKLVSLCPQKVFTLQDNKSESGEIKQTVVVSRPNKCILCEECVNYSASIYQSQRQNPGRNPTIRYDDMDEDIVLTTEKRNFRFEVETTGALEVSDIIRFALGALRERLSVLAYDLKRVADE